MTALWILLGPIAAIILGRCILRWQAARQRWQGPTEGEMDAAGERVQDYIHRLGEDAEERSPRFRNWSPS